MSYSKPKLTRASFNELMDKARSDAALKQKLLDTLDAKGVLGIGEDFFTLDDLQREKLRVHNRRPKGLPGMVADGIRSGLETGGIVKLEEPSGGKRIGCSVVVIVDADGSWEVGLSCEI